MLFDTIGLVLVMHSEQPQRVLTRFVLPKAFQVFILLFGFCFLRGVYATDYSDGDIHKNDFKWLQFNLMQSLNNKLPNGNEKDTYMEMEFGGRNGILQFYGYYDAFDIFDRDSDDLHGKENLFLKFAPRLSLDAIFQNDFSFGPVKELYISGLINVGESGLFDKFLGFGADVEIPWLGTVGTSIMARHATENFGAEDEGKWSGYIWTNHWFKPFFFFDDKSFIAYQGYFDYKFKYDKLADSDPKRSKSSIEWFNGFYWHSDQWSVGYGLKYYKDMANFKDGKEYDDHGTPPTVLGKQKTSGVGHYFAIIYKI